MDWPYVGGIPIKPPHFIKRIGRPKKARKRAADEPRPSQRVTREGGTSKCGRCGQDGHNARRCTNEVTDPVYAERMRKVADRARRNRLKKQQEEASTSSSQPPLTLAIPSEHISRQKIQVLKHTIFQSIYYAFK